MTVIATTPTDQTLKIRAATNKWVSDQFPEQRRYLSHSWPELGIDGHWRVGLMVRHGDICVPLATLTIEKEQEISTDSSPRNIAEKINSCLPSVSPQLTATEHSGHLHQFNLGDGITGSSSLPDKSIDLLLTDPPYGISNPYTCEKQVPRRLRKNGRDFIMPKGHFGDWDYSFPSPSQWLPLLLPKVRGWTVIFCAQAQIGEYSEILRDHKFNAVGAMVWWKTNPVPFNHTTKPINAWEAIVAGKRPGTKFNGRVVHNVFVHKSPSPQERIHSTQKPLPLLSEFVKLFSKKGDFVVDPFAGSATTLIAAVELKRRVLAYENDVTAFSKAVNRIEKECLL